MPPKTSKSLEDSRDAAALVREAVQCRTIDDDRRDRRLRQAIERNVEIIGEAVNRIAKLDPDVAAGSGKHRQIIAFRSVLIHGHDVVDHRIAWSVIEEELLVLLAEVELPLSVARRP